MVDTKTQSPVDDIARADGLKRKIGAWIPNFANLGPLLANTNFIATLPPLTMVDVLPEFDLLALKPGRNRSLVGALPVELSSDQ